MRKSGRTSKYPKELLEKVVKEYLTTDKSAKEIEKEFNVPEHVIRYHAKKERTENQNEKD